jgi:O-antigen/teichoic acid export membrane protein
LRLIIKGKQIISSTLGIDKAIGYTILGRIVQAGGSIVSLSLIALFLTKEEQGFYYTFGSIMAIQIFFELGFNGIITQYAAHETAHITGYAKSDQELERKAQSRLSSLLQFCVKWFSILSLLLFIILLIIGYIFFAKYGHGANVNWQLPWLLLVINTSLSFLLSPIFSFIEGLGKVKEIARLRLVQQLISLTVLWSMLSLGSKLYSAPIAGIASLGTIVVLLLFSDFKKILFNIWTLLDAWKVDYKNEIFPYQWKIAISWMSGYFIFQLFNPVLFATEGAIVAGQMGMTLAVLNGITGLTISWMTTKVPIFSGLIAQEKYSDLDRLFNRTLKQSATINGLSLSAMFIGIYGLRHFNLPIGERFLPYLPLAFMIIPVFLNQYVSSWATYLRCHKKEPFLVLSVVMGIATSLSTFILGNYFGALGMTAGYCFLTFFGGFAWGWIIFKKKKSEWHK